MPHRLSNVRMAQTIADFAWLDLTSFYFTLVAVLVAVLVAHCLSAFVKSGEFVHSFSPCCIWARRRCAPPPIKFAHGSDFC